MPIGSAALIGLGSAAASYLGGTQANQANKDIAQTNRAFQDYESSTAYQRATKDMAAAGLNPMLAYQQGGATTPAGAMATMQNVLGPAASSGVSAYESINQAKQQQQQIAQSQAQVDLIKAQTEVASAQAANTRSDTLIKDIQQGYWRSMIPKVQADTRLSQKTRDLVVKQIQNAALTGFNIVANTGNTQADTVLKELQVNQGSAFSNFFGSDIGKAAPYLDKTLTWSNSAANILKPIGGKWSIGDTYNTGARSTSVINYGKD